MTEPAAEVRSRAVVRPVAVTIAQRVAALPGPAWGALSMLFVGGALAGAAGLESVTARHQTPAGRALLGGWYAATIRFGAWARLPDTQATMVLAGVVLSGCWLLLALGCALRPMRLEAAVGAALLLCIPFTAGVPILSRDSYAYLAQGEVARRGLNPYAHPVIDLGGHDVLLRAVDPVWRRTIPPYGPGSLRLCEFAATVAHWMRSPLAGLVVLKLLALAGVAVTAGCVAVLARPHRRSLALWLTVSPLTLTQLLGAAHLEALVAAAMAGALLWLQRRRRVAALLVAALGVSLKLTAAVLLVAVVLAALPSPATLRRVGGRARLAAFAPAAGWAVSSACAVAAVLFALHPVDPLGWLRGLNTPTSVWDPLTASTGLAIGLRHILPAVGLGLRAHPGLWAAVPTVSRSVVGGLALVAVVAIVAGARRRELPLTAAYLLATTALLGPVFWPWYLAPVCALLLASTSVRAWVAALLVGSSAVSTLPLRVVSMQRVAYVSEAVALTGLLVVAVLLRRDRRERLEPLLRVRPPTRRRGGGP